MYSALQNENGVSCFAVIVSERQLIIPYGGRNCKRHPLEAGILKNCDG
jgi:hypothetical protein